MKFSFGISLLVVVLVGCTGSKSAKGEKKPKKDEVSALAGQTVNVAAGKGTYSDDKNIPLWDVHWEESAVRPDAGGLATFRKVHGSIYSKDKPATTYEADAAKVDRKQNLLVLHGHVVLVSKDPKVTITCDDVRYERADPKNPIIKAIGNVRAQGDGGDMGPSDELWATEDLNIIATPNLFKSR